MALAIETFILGDFQTNCFVLWDDADLTKTCWIVDCSYNPEPMLDFIEQRGFKPALCILTHCHCDHVAGLAKMRRRLGPVNILCHRAEKDFNEDPNLNLSVFIPPAVSAPPPDACLNGGEMLEDMHRTLHEVLLRLPDTTVIHPGHGAATTIGRERAMNSFLRPNAF